MIEILLTLKLRLRVVTVNYTVKKGECISSIAKKYGLFPETIWNESGNAALREKRQNPDILKDGDVVVIPEMRRKEISIATDTSHKFIRKGVPVEFKIRLLLGEEPRANESYRLEIDGKLYEGKTDAQGWIKQRIPPNSKQGKLLLDDEEEEYLLSLGHLDPIDETTGFQMRLAHLGYYDGDINGKLDDQTTEALRAFQKQNSLEESGEPDDSTQSALTKMYGS